MSFKKSVTVPLKKSGKKKKKKSEPFETFQWGKVEALKTKRKGRHLVAVQDLRVGEIAFTEIPFAFVSRFQCRESHCAHCLNFMSSSISCNYCGDVFYCCKECLESDALVHDHLCSLLDRISTIAFETRCDVDLLRLALRICSEAYSAQPRKPHTTFKDILGLMHQQEAFSPEWREAVDAGVKACWQYFPEHLKSISIVDVPEIVRICCRINVNAHGLNALGHRNTDVGLGLFCISPLINHSCDPNCVFVSVGREMRLVANRPIAKSEEITISYIDSFETRISRKEELLRSKFFSCKCNRCSTPIENSVDRFLDGILCPNPKCSDSILLSKEEELYCSFCSSTYSLEALESIQLEILELKTLAAKHRKNGERRREKELLETFMKRSKNVYHTLHVQVMDSRVRLMNCYDQLRLLSDSTAVVSEIIKSLDQVLPVYHKETANFLFHLGSTYIDIMETIQISSSKELSFISNQTAKARLFRSKAVEALDRCFKIRSLLFGSEDSFTKSVKEKRDSIMLS